MSRSKLSLQRNSALESVEDAVIAEYSTVSLARSGFSFARASKGRQLEAFRGNSVSELEQFIGKGKLMVVPRRDMSLPPEALPPEDVGFTLLLFAD